MLKHSEELLNIDGSIVRIITPENYDETARPLAVFNGLGAGVHDWDDIPEQLERQIIAIDVRRTKRLGFFGLIGTMGAYAKAARRSLDAVTDRVVDALGFSWGGLLVEHEAIYEGNRFGRLVLAATGPGGTPIPTNMFAAMGILSSNRPAMPPQQINGSNGNVPYDSEIESNGPMRGFDPLANWNQLTAALTCGKNYFSLTNLENPTLIMAGENDPISPLPYAQHLHALLPHSQLHVVGRGDHYFLFDQPAESTNVIKQFLDAA